MEKIAVLLALGAGWLNPGTEQARPAQTAPAQPAAPAQDAGPAWQLICPPAPAPTPSATPATPPPAPTVQPCSLVQNLLAGEQKQRLLTVILQRNATSTHTMTVALPHGVLFPAGVTLQVDEGVSKTLVVQTSDQNGAYTATPIDAPMLASLSTGKTLKVGFTAGSGQKIVVPVTLKDFPAGVTALDKTPLPRPAAPAAPTPAKPSRP